VPPRAARAQPGTARAPSGSSPASPALGSVISAASPEFRPTGQAPELSTPYTPAFQHRKVICDFFIRAGLDELAAPCTKGDKCQFLHPPAVAPNGSATTRICLDYFLGYCAAGQACTRLHPLGRFSDNILFRYNLLNE
jgi:hypothetical protein